MPRNGSGAFSNVPGTTVSPNTTILSAWANAFSADVAATFNEAWPVFLGGTGGTDAATARVALGAAAVSATVSNAGLAFAVSTGSLTISLKTSDGATNPSASNPVSVRMPSSTVLGAYNMQSVSGALSATIPSTATMGRTNGLVGHLYHYLIDNSGALELAVSGKFFSETGIISTTILNTASDSGDVMYSTTARTNVPYRLIGRSIDTQTTAGTWASVPTKFDLMPNSPFPVRFEATTTFNLTNATATKVPVGTEEFDVGGFFDAATNYRFQPPAGTYHMYVSGGPDGTGTGQTVDTGTVVVRLYKNGSLYRNLNSLQASTTTSLIASGVATVVANGSDYYEGFLTQSNGGTKQCTAMFGGYRVDETGY